MIDCFLFQTKVAEKKEAYEVERAERRKQQDQERLEREKEREKERKERRSVLLKKWQVFSIKIVS